MPRKLSDRFAFAHQLQSARNEAQLLSMAQIEVERTTGYRHCWLYLLTPDRTAFELIEVAGPVPSRFYEHCLILPVAGDRMLEEIAEGLEPVVVVDARLDPRTNQEMAKKSGCITLISIPIRLPDYPLGGLGSGTFNEEGVHPPSPEQLLILVDIADQVAVALARIRHQTQRHDAQREKNTLLSQLAQLKRQETLFSIASELFQEQGQMVHAALQCTAKLDLEGVSQDQHHHLQVLRSNLERMAELSLPFTKLGKHRSCQVLQIDLNQRLADTLAVIVPLLPEEAVVEAEFEIDLPTVLGAASLLDEVFLNLMLTAKDDLEKGGRLSLHTRAQQSWVECEIRLSEISLGRRPLQKVDWDLCDHILRQHGGSLHCFGSEKVYRCLVRLPTPDAKI